MLDQLCSSQMVTGYMKPRERLMIEVEDFKEKIAKNLLVMCEIIFLFE